MKNCNNKKNRKSKKENAEDFSMKSAKTDPNGSWTGVPEDEYEKPIQDADDL